MKYVFILVIMVGILSNGCANYKGGTFTEGRTLQAGVRLPTAESSATLQLLSYLNGFVLAWEDGSIITIERTTSEKFSALGIWADDTTSTTKVTLNPAEATPTH